MSFEVIAQLFHEMWKRRRKSYGMRLCVFKNRNFDVFILFRELQKRKSIVFHCYVHFSFVCERKCVRKITYGSVYVHLCIFSLSIIRNHNLICVVYSCYLVNSAHNDYQEGIFDIIPLKVILSMIWLHISTERSMNTNKKAKINNKEYRMTGLHSSNDVQKWHTLFRLSANNREFEKYTAINLVSFGTNLFTVTIYNELWVHDIINNCKNRTQHQYIFKNTWKWKIECVSYCCIDRILYNLVT